MNIIILKIYIIFNNNNYIKILQIFNKYNINNNYIILTG